MIPVQDRPKLDDATRRRLQRHYDHAGRCWDTAYAAGAWERPANGNGKERPGAQRLRDRFARAQRRFLDRWPTGHTPHSGSRLAKRLFAAFCLVRRRELGEDEFRRRWPVPRR